MSSFVAFALLTSAAAQTGQLAGPVVRPAPQTVLDGFGIKQATLQDLSIPGSLVAGFELVVDFDGKAYQLVLREHDIRAADFKLIASGKNGMKVLPTPASSTYRGVVAGHADSQVAASLIGGQLTAFVRLAGLTTPWSVQALSKLVPTANRATYVVHNGRDVKPSRHRCGVDHTVPAPVSPGRPKSSGNGPIYECELALDLDFDEYKKHGSDTIATQYDATSIINACNVIYSRDVEVEFLLTTIIVRTSQVYSSSNYNTLLSDYRSRWRSNHSGVRRDVTHLLTGKFTTSGVIGVAYLRSICSTRNGYGLSFTHFSNDFQQRVGLTAHELGHSFGANHCDTASGGCFIMCSNLYGCNGSLTMFGSASKSAIISYRNGRSCLRQKSGNEPRLDSVSPGTVQAFRGGTVTLTGINFTGATQVTVGDTVLTPGTDPRTSFRIVSDTSITFEAPTGASYAPHAVYIQNAAGFSGRLHLRYSVTNPRKLDVEALLRRGGSANWEFGAGARHSWILTVSPSPSTYRFLGLTWLQSPLILIGGTLDRAGTGSSKVTVPNNAPIGLTFYSQVVTINPFKNKFGGNTNVTTSRIQ
ncbi:MAG: M12 family metallo-peptidase [Planctomycetota bacterium]|nr:M12 family metallo-peptidase [Planctomycetota bacterium]